MKARGGVKVNLHSFLTLAVNGSVWSAPQVMKRQLVKQGNYSTVANCRTKLSAEFRKKFEILRGILRV
jgi:hypothetical protein